jgi:hypothetical protein
MADASAWKLKPRRGELVAGEFLDYTTYMSTLEPRDQFLRLLGRAGIKPASPMSSKILVLFQGSHEGADPAPLISNS